MNSANLEDLKLLLYKVEAGIDTAHDHARAFPSESAYGHCTWHDSHKASTQGSLDAAKALHEALLPGWHWQKGLMVGGGEAGRRWLRFGCHMRKMKNGRYS